MSQHYEIEQSGVYNGRELTYTFTLDVLPVRNAKGAHAGSASLFSYVADVPEEERARRPVVFLFNGGPGAASAYLHLSGIGPKRVAVPTDLADSINPPYVVEDSPNSILDVADLVFMDPVNTGFGRLLPDAAADDLYSVQGDARYFADLVCAWVTRQNRWDSPKYVLGESYGTHRAPFMVTALAGIKAVPFDGIILLGQALNVQETVERPGNVAGAVAGLPFKAATAWYHGVGAHDHAGVDAVVEAALEFAYGDFAAAMTRGSRLDEDERVKIAARLEYFTGVPAETYLRKRLWLSKGDFLKELLADSGRVLGRNDARYVSRAADTSAGEADIEPSFAHLAPAFNAGILRYLHGTLAVPTEEEYRVFDESAVARWDWSDAGSARFMQMGKPSPFHVYPYPARLTQYLKQVPRARLFIGTGHYDSLTTVGAVEHLLRQYDLPLERVTDRRYPAGHMMYTDPESLRMLDDDLRAFVSA
ncbi:S10 family peptidase [Nonomuraea bangladeshensis]|uniref:S10 family peptidase n=1 Tax=Nonomuraea bangladeshensis TaxID=404385 RepID=UPI0031D39B62